MNQPSARARRGADRAHGGAQPDGLSKTNVCTELWIALRGNNFYFVRGE